MKTMIGQTVLDSRNSSRSSPSVNDNQNPKNQRFVDMRIAALQEDLLFLSQILQENLLAEVTSGELFTVKCAVKNHRIMILTQHPQSVTPNTDQVFTVLGEVLKSLPAHQSQKVQMYLRKVGEKLPYAQSVLIFGAEISKESAIDEIPNLDYESQYHQDNTTSANLYPPPNPEDFEVSAPLITITADVVEEPFDPLAGIPEKRESTSKPQRNYKPILGGAAAMLVMAFFGGGAYLLMSPYVMVECKELQTSKQLQQSLPQLARNVKSQTELTQILIRVNNALAQLQKIPSWSPQRSQAEIVTASLKTELRQIQQVSMALQTGAVAAQKARSLSNNIEELQARQQLWRQAIAPLEAIRPNSQFYGFAQSQLTAYRSGLQSINVQLQAQGKWQQKLNDAQAAAKVAIARETTAKSLPELKKALLTWQIVVNALIAIPQTSPAYPNARTLLASYQPRLMAIRLSTSKIELAATSLTQAVTTAKLAQQYQQQNQWQAAAIRWQQALNSIKQVPNDSPFYSQAQPLVEAYSVALQEAQTKFQTTATTASTDTTHKDLKKTCTATVRVCNFTVDSRVITVRITPQYEQTLQNNIEGSNSQKVQNVANVTKHLETLQQALEIIGDNANLAVLVFDAQGQPIFTHIPRHKQ
jgi:hypothetical protein